MGVSKPYGVGPRDRRSRRRTRLTRKTMDSSPPHPASPASGEREGILRDVYEDCALTAAQSARWEFATLGWCKLLDGHRGSRLSERKRSQPAPQRFRLASPGMPAEFLGSSAALNSGMRGLLGEPRRPRSSKSPIEHAEGKRRPYGPRSPSVPPSGQLSNSVRWLTRCVKAVVCGETQDFEWAPGGRCSRLSASSIGISALLFLVTF